MAVERKKSTHAKKAELVQQATEVNELTAALKLEQSRLQQVKETSAEELSRIRHVYDEKLEKLEKITAIGEDKRATAASVSVKSVPGVNNTDLLLSMAKEKNDVLTNVCGIWK